MTQILQLYMRIVICQSKDGIIGEIKAGNFRTLAVAEALEHIMSKDLSHPGVLHLHIHLIEASAEPERALVAADNLERTIPIVGHVVHMPSHIYVRVGQYQKALEQYSLSKS